MSSCSHINQILGFAEPINSWTHLLGALVFLCFTIYLLRPTGLGREHPFSIIMFGGSCVLLFSISGIYHLLTYENEARFIFQVIDHAAITILIASSLTVIHNLCFSGFLKWGVIIIVWVLAILGITLKSIFFKNVPEFLSLLSYLVFGWLGSISFITLWKRENFFYSRNIIYGGLAYSVGAIMEFYRIPVIIPGVLEAHELFHIAVLLGAIFHGHFILELLIRRKIIIKTRVKYRSMPNMSTKENIEAWSKNAEIFGVDFFEKYKNEGDFWHKELINENILTNLGSVKDKKVLDAGCGEGYFSRILARKRAVVTGLEPSDSIKYAMSYEKDKALGIEYLREDLCEFNDRKNYYDAVISINVLMDIPDFAIALQNCVVSLKKNGILIFSILHPCFISIMKDQATEEYIKKWDYEENGHLKIERYLNEMQLKQTEDVLTHRTLSTYLNATINSGLTIKNIIEPKLADEFEVQKGKTLRDCHVPSFLIVCAEKN